MADLFWPGDERAGDMFTSAAFLRALANVETAWLGSLANAGIAPAAVAVDLTMLVAGDAAVQQVSRAAESGGNPVLGLLALLRGRVEGSPAEAWLHRGLTSQDVVDTALMLCAADARTRLLEDFDRICATLAALAETHRADVMAGRTLTQHAVPVTFGLKAATWLSGILDARDAVRALRLPVQLGGAAGTLAASVEITQLSGAANAVATATDLAARTARALGLEPAAPWHTVRTPITRVGDALVATSDALGHLASDVALLSRTEIGELSEGSGGGSSAMPLKANPVLSVLIRRAALSAPLLGAQLHLSAATQADERSDGAWHAEWAALATLTRRTLVAASQGEALLAGLRVHPERMRATAAAARHQLLAEQRRIEELMGVAADSGSDSGAEPRLESYLGATDALIDAVLERSRRSQR